MPGVRLGSACPNPFNPRTTISYVVGAGVHARLAVYDVAGRLVRKLVDEPVSTGGRMEASWDGRDENGRLAAAGIYFYRLEAGSDVKTKRMVMVK